MGAALLGMPLCWASYRLLPHQLCVQCNVSVHNCNASGPLRDGAGSNPGGPYGEGGDYIHKVRRAPTDRTVLHAALEP